DTRELHELAGQQQKANSSTRDAGSAGQQHEDSTAGGATGDTRHNASSAPPWAEQLIDGAAFIFDQPHGIPALWGSGTEVVWAEGESLMIAGGQGLGKTTLAGLLLRAQLGLGDAQVLGQPIKRQQCPVLYLAMDRPRQIARSLARQFTPDERAAVEGRLIIWQGTPPADVARKPEILTLLAQQAGAGVVFLDSLKDAVVGLSDDEVGAGYNRARQMLLTDGRELCELHHLVKRNANGGAPREISDIYGSAWLTSGCGSVVLMTGDPGDPVFDWRHLKQPGAEVGPFKVQHDQTVGALSIFDKVDLVKLAAAAGGLGLTVDGAARALFTDGKKDPTDAQKAKARRRLDGLVAAGELTRVDGQKGGSGGGVRTTWFPSAFDCSVCGKPRLANQTDTHLSCRESAR
ncbi:MAG: AAA family ATPase, partial [Actinomycetota bacterium]